MKLPAYDKLLHFIAGTYIYLIFAIFLHPALALLGVVIIGVGKEFIWDKHLANGCLEIKDFIYTFAGGLMSLLLTMF